MGSAMRATAEPAEGNRVRLCVEIDEPEMDKVLDDAVRTMAREARVPGFRPGRVPRQVLEARMGGAVALRAEALKEALPDFYARAVVDTDVDPISPPEIDITSGEEQGAVAFDAIVEIRPTVAIPGYGGLQVTVPSLEVSDAEVDAQLDRMRDTEAELVDVARPATDGDHVTINLHGTFPDGSEALGADDLLYEVGSGKVTPELDVELRGAKVGDVLSFTADAPSGPRGSTTVSFRVLVKEVKEKHLPDLTDEWAAESSEHATVDELRREISGRLARVKALQARMARRESVIDALVGLVDDEEVPDVLVAEEMSSRVHDLSHRLEEQRVPLEDYLTATGRTGDQLVEEVRESARRAVKADLALRAVAAAEGLEVDEEEVTAEVASMAARMDMTPRALRTQLDRAGRIAAVRSELKKAKALEWLLEHTGMVDEEGNEISAEKWRELAESPPAPVDPEGAAEAGVASGEQAGDAEGTEG